MAPTCVELFSGAGGLMLGLEAAGFTTLVCNEVHRHPCMTLRRNFPHVPVIEASVKDLDGKSLFTAAGYEHIPDIDLVAGGPPCQGFSTAGLKEETDPRNSLIGDFIRLVSDLRPRAFLLENVTGLLTMKNGRLFDNVLNELDSLGYKFHHKILYAANFGIPQMRRRLIVLGAREEAPPPFPESTHRPAGRSVPGLFDADAEPYVTCGDALGDLPELDPGQTKLEFEREPTAPYQIRMRLGARTLFNHQASSHRPSTMAYYALVPPGGNWLDIPADLRNAKQGVQRWPLDGIARTVTTEPTDFLHPTKNRIPTIRELARIQSFPDRFEFMGQRTGTLWKRSFNVDLTEIRYMSARRALGLNAIRSASI